MIELDYEFELTWAPGVAMKLISDAALPQILKYAVQIESRAKRLSPVDTGRLRSSISHEVGTRGAEIFARIGTNVDYAKYVELGTSRMAARSFLRSAAYAVLGGP